MSSRPAHHPYRLESLVFAVHAVLLAAGAVAALWYSAATLRGVDALDRELRIELHRLGQGTARLTDAFEDLGEVGDEAGSARAGGALEDLQALSAEIERVVRRAGSPEQLPQAQGALARLAAGASEMVRAHGEDAREGARFRIRDAAASVELVLDRVELTAVDAASARRARCVGALMLAGALAFAQYLAASLWFRARTLATMRRRFATLRESAAQLAAELDATTRGEPARPATVAPGLELLSAASERARAALDRTRDTLRFERLRATFTHDLAEALDLADSEAEVCATAARAAEVAFPRATFQLLLADNSHARLSPHVPERAVRCTPESPHACPALRRSRTLLHHGDGGMARCQRLAPCAESVACAAISVHGRSIGVAQIASTSIDAGALETLTGMSLALGARVGVVRTLGERELAAATDALTGLANRRAMNERLARLDRQDVPYAIVAADLDHFKRLNDTYGHEVGDRCLRLFSQVLREACRAHDAACRPGGEEFALVLEGADIGAAARVAERVHALLADATRRAGIPFTASLGTAARPLHGPGAEEVLRAADAALYAAKTAGRNCTRAFGMPEVVPLSSAA